jgi:hypothetical protein
MNATRNDECPQCSRIGEGPLCKSHRPLTTADLLDMINHGARGVFNHRAYLNSRDQRVMLIDMTYPDDVERMAHYIAANTTLHTEVITATPFGASPRRRIVVTGFAR